MQILRKELDQPWNLRHLLQCCSQQADQVQLRGCTGCTAEGEDPGLNCHGWHKAFVLTSGQFRCS